MSPTRPPTLPDRWNDASGGLGYHWRAWRFRRRLWHGFHLQVAQWLDDWQPPAKTLILVGPSAGYALPAHFVARFAQHVAIEPDPLARWLLRRRFASVSWQFAQADVFADEHALEHLSETYPDSAVLFCNVIGQVLDADSLVAWRNRHAPWFASHHWASWHDVFSSDRAPLALPSADEIRLGPEASTSVAKRLWQGQRCRVEDHGSFNLWPQAQHVAWPLTPAQWHVVAWVSHTGRLPEGESAIDE